MDSHNDADTDAGFQVAVAVRFIRAFFIKQIGSAPEQEAKQSKYKPVDWKLPPV